MGLLIPTPKLAGNERLLWRSPAGFTSPRPTVGGTLYVTTERLLFVPNRLNFLPQTRAVRDWPIRQLSSVSVMARDYTPYTGGMHHRLDIRLENGEHLLFVVKNVSHAVEELRQLVATGVDPYNE
jgi:hypothetical protein